MKNFRTVRKPGNVLFKEDDHEIRLILDGGSVKHKNMQMDANAFEGWAIAARACALEEDMDCGIILDVSPEVHYGKTKEEGHLARFLYRAMRFAEQYDWFKLSDSLLQEVERFRQFLESGIFINNIASCDAGNTDREDENTMEEKMSNGRELKNLLIGTVDVGDNPVYRQLPVGLFKDGVSKENSIFTGGKSAIDLWTYNDQDISIVELKYRNKKVGIITEIFFYANYMYDLISENDWFIVNNTPDKTFARGYEKLTVNGYETVNGIMLANKNGFHPLVNEKSLKVLNDSNNRNIRYYMKEY